MGKSVKALTLVELSVVTLIIMVAVIPAYRVFVDSLGLTNYAKELTIAVDDASDVLEKIKTIAFSDLLNIFANNTTINSNTIGGYLLNNESIRVVYPNGINEDPLLIEINVSWSSKSEKTHSLIFRTLRTSYSR